MTKVFVMSDPHLGNDNVQPTAASVGTGICAQCQAPSDGSERHRELGDSGSLWLHEACEAAFLQRRLAEEGVTGGTAVPSKARSASTAAGNGAAKPRKPPLNNPAKSALGNSQFVTLTRFTNANDESLTKKLSVAPDNSLVSDSSAMVMVRGTADRIVVDGVAGLGALIEQLKPSQALALGGLRMDLPDKVDVTTKRRLLGGTARLDLIARTNDNIVYDGPAFVLVDFDTKGMPPQVAEEIGRHGGFWGALKTVLPGLDNLARLTRSSTSAGLSRSDTGVAIPGSDGIHAYLIAQRGDDAERFLRALHERCWLAGLGWMMVGAAGQLLERSIIDRMVGQSGRLVFEGGPLLVAPLVQDKAKRRPVAVEGAELATEGACPPLSIVEKSRLGELKAKDRARVKPEEVKAKEKSVTEKTRKLRAARPDLSASAARAIVIRQYEGILRPDVVLPWDDEELAGCTVADVLADPAKFAGETLADPLEGVDYGRCVAKVMIRDDGTPWIHSFAHGRTIYALKFDAAAVRKAMEAAAKVDVVKTFTSLAVIADLDAVEIEELRQLAKNLSGIGLRVISAALKAAMKQHADSSAVAARAHQAAIRTDPRPLILAPLETDPWLPEMSVLNEVIGQVDAIMPPFRDVNFATTRACNPPAINMHAFTDGNEPEERNGE
jgi:hypothetical protein